MVDTTVLDYSDDLAVEAGPGQAARGGSIHRRRRLVLASVLAAGGFLAMAAGWIGVSSTRVVSEQLSYLASGGVFGVGLIGAAAALLVADFMLAQEEALEEIRAAVVDSGARATLSRPGVPATAGGAGLVAVKGGNRVHRPTCQLVAGKDGVEELDANAASQSGLQPCRVCRPAVGAVR